MPGNIPQSLTCVKGIIPRFCAEVCDFRTLCSFSETKRRSQRMGVKNSAERSKQVTRLTNGGS
jgi:hypothetical protein